MSRPSSALRSLRRAAFAGLLSSLAACQALEAHTYNLRELHDDEGDHLRSAALLSDGEYLVRYGIASLLRKGDLPPGTPRKVKDPLGECVENLLELASIEASSEGFEALKVEAFARYAMRDPWQISRQICLDQLGRHGKRLELERHPAPVEPTGPVATPEDLRRVIQPLVDASTKRGLPPDFALAPALQAIADLRYDDDGILRALATAGALLNREATTRAHREALLALVMDLERRTIRRALARGLEDDSAHVRAIAVHAGVRAEGNAFLLRVMPRLLEDADPPVPLAILDAVKRRGLPKDEGGSSEGALATLYRCSTEHPADDVRVAGMRALGSVSGAGFESLREEDWQAWWYARPAAAAAGKAVPRP